MTTAPTSPATHQVTEKRYLTRADVRALLGWSRWTLRRLIVTKRFPEPTAGEGKLARWPAWLVVGIAEGTIDAATAARDAAKGRGRR